METLLNSLQRFPLHKGKTTQIVFVEPHQNIALCLTFAYPEIRTANVPAYTTTFFELHTLLFSPCISNLHILARYPYILARCPSHASYIPTLQHIDPLTRPYSEIRW